MPRNALIVLIMYPWPYRAEKLIIVVVSVLPGCHIDTETLNYTSLSEKVHLYGVWSDSYCYRVITGKINIMRINQNTPNWCADALSTINKERGDTIIDA